MILVADGHDGRRSGAAEVLRRGGYQVTEAATGSDALRLYRHTRPDLAVLDADLRDANGADVCRMLKDDADLAPVYVLQTSGAGAAPAAPRLSGAADARLVEPIDADVLLTTIATLLRLRLAELSLAAATSRERLARDDADRAGRIKDEFLSTLSHELRTPLSAIVGWIWQLRHGAPDDAIRQRAVDAIERSTNVQIRLINDLVDIARLGRGALELDAAPVDLEAVIEAAATAVQASLKVKQLALTTTTAPLTIVGDPARLEQIVGNLLANAVKFSVPNGRIDVSLAAVGATAVVRVRDTGVGIDAAVLPHVFDEFHRRGSGTVRRHHGLGIGLVLVRELVALHGGTVSAESDGVGRGATFTVRLPMAGVAAGGRGPALPTAIVGRPLEGARLLIVDDDVDIREWLKNLIEFGGGAAVAADSVVTALDCLARERFDILVSDIAMPAQDGIALIRTLRARGDLTPAVAVTALASPDDRRRILAAGYTAYFAKPIDPAVFLGELAKLRAKPATPASDSSAPV